MSQCLVAINAANISICSADISVRKQTQLVTPLSCAFKTSSTSRGNCPSPPPDPIIVPQVFKLAADEHLVGVQGYTGTLIDRLEIVTNKRVLGPFGASTEGQRFSLVAPQGYKVRRLFGRSGGFIDSVGIIVERDS